MHSLALFHRIAGQPVSELGKGDVAAAKARLIERAGGVVVREETAAAALAFVALDQPEAVVARLRARGVLVNTADRPDLCDFTLPSVLERGPVLVAVATGGASAGLAKALRLRLEALLPASLGALAEGLANGRARIRARWPDPAERRRAIDTALGQGGVCDVLGDGPADGLEAWLGSEVETAAGVHEFHLASDDPDDLTLRQARLLGSADLVAHDPGIAPAILARARADAARQELGPDTALARCAGITVILRRG
jgi:uroporphyrin-III C-methyltransferase/precorrin-2 dehydrogenase/sirohydrochlorin ferrochelatase